MKNARAASACQASLFLDTVVNRSRSIEDPSVSGERLVDPNGSGINRPKLARYKVEELHSHPMSCAVTEL
jgi:hypothetical protein